MQIENEIGREMCTPDGMNLYKVPSTLSAADDGSFPEWVSLRYMDSEPDANESWK